MLFDCTEINIFGRRIIRAVHGLNENKVNFENLSEVVHWVKLKENLVNTALYIYLIVIKFDYNVCLDI